MVRVSGKAPPPEAQTYSTSSLGLIRESAVDHPYKRWEDSELWRAFDAELATLERNRDVTLLTGRAYVIGALCQAAASTQVASVPERFQCALCGHGALRTDAQIVALLLRVPTDEDASQQLWVHHACLRRVIDPTVALVSELQE
jgi:hypothetical protein